jgi:hypothetical protein
MLTAPANNSYIGPNNRSDASSRCRCRLFAGSLVAGKSAREEEKTNEEVLERAIADVREVFVRELDDIYDAEHRFLEGQRERPKRQAIRS